jgi:hypothetical protein
VLFPIAGCGFFAFSAPNIDGSCLFGWCMAQKYRLEHKVGAPLSLLKNQSNRGIGLPMRIETSGLAGVQTPLWGGIGNRAEESHLLGRPGG